MKTKTIQILGVAAIVALAGGVLAERLGDQSTTSARAGEPALPGLRDAVNDVSSVTVQAGGETLTFERSGDGWAAEEKGGYPAKAEKLRSLVLALRELEVVEEKTSDGARFDRLGLVEPGAEGSTSKRIVLRGEGGAEIASLLVGDRRASRGSMGAMGLASRPAEMHYVFAGEEGDPALLVSGRIVADTRVANWFDTTLMSIGQDRFAAARYTAADGGEVEIVPGAEDGELRLLGVPEGKEPRGAAALNPAKNALSGLRFDDVAPEGEIDFGDASLATAEVFTEHGLKITVETVEVPDPEDADTTRVWARFAAAYAPEDSPAPEPASEPVRDDDGDGDSTGETDEDGEEDAPSAEDLEEEAADLDERLGGWAFALPSWKTSALRMRMEDLVQDAPPPLTPIDDPAAEAVPEAVPEGDGDGAEAPAGGEPAAEEPASGDPAEPPGGNGGGDGGE